MTGDSWCKPSIIVHGGAWKIPAALTDKSLEGVRRAALAGYQVLSQGGSALDAVEAAVCVLENDPVFDAGKGSCLNNVGEVEMDAVIMSEESSRPHSLQAGAVAAVSQVKNPVRLARKVLEQTRHCLLVGQNADKFAEDSNKLDKSIELVSSWKELVTDDAAKEWETYQKYQTVVTTLFNSVHEQNGHDTVGAVAVDAHGMFAAATSTGGITNKMAGRVGDSPIIGSGAYVSCEAGAVSATGHGESIMKIALSKHALHLVEHGDMSAHDAAVSSLNYMQRKTGGRGGLIIVDKNGRVAHSFTTERMAWASIESGDGGQLKCGIDRD